MMMMMMMMMTVMMTKMLFMIYAVCFYDSQCFLCIITRKDINDYYVSHIALYQLIQRFIDYTVTKHGCPLNQFWLTGSRVSNYMS